MLQTQPNIRNPHPTPWRESLIHLGAPILVLGILAVSYPSFSAASIKPFLRVLIIGVPLAALVLRLTRWEPPALVVKYASTALCTFTFFLAFCFLFDKWLSGQASHAIGGFIPFSDAADYYRGASSLIEFGQVTPWSARRPLASCFYAALLFVTGQNLLWTYVCATLLLAWSLFFCARAMRDLFGFSGALLYLILSLYFIAPHIGTFMSEIPGFLYSNIALGLLMRGFSRKHFPCILAGVVMLGFSISLRAGAFLVLPVLAACWFFLFKEPGRRFYLRTLAMAGACVFSLMASPLLLLAVGPEEEYTYQGNFSYTLYGLASGGKGWDFVKREHPEINYYDNNKTDGAYSRIIYGYAWKKIKEQPGLFAHALFNTWYHIVRHPFFFSYKFDFPFPLSIFLLPFGVFWLSLFLRMDKSVKRVLLLLSSLQGGIFLSAPFLVDGGDRVYASTMPVNCAILAAGIALLFGGGRPAGTDAGATATPPLPRSDIRIIGFFLLLLLASPFFFKAFHASHAQPAVADADTDTLTVRFRYTRGSAIFAEAETTTTAVPRVTVTGKDREKVLQTGAWGLGSVETGSMLMTVTDLSGSRNYYYIYFTPGDIPVHTGILSARILPLNQPRKGRNLYRVLSYDYVQ